MEIINRDTSKTKLPFGVWVAIGLSALNLGRLSALTYLSKVGDAIPDFWGVAYRGDIFMGATALIIVTLLLRFRGLMIWTIAIVWHWIGLKDFITGLEFHLIQPFDPSMGNLSPLLLLSTGIVFHLIASYLLVKHRSIYLATDTQPKL